MRTIPQFLRSKNCGTPNILRNTTTNTIPPPAADPPSNTDKNNDLFF